MTSSTPTANRIREYRKRRQLKLADIARLTGVPRPTHIWEWERGSHAPSLHNALKLSAAIDCPVEVLFSQEFEVIRKNVQEIRKQRNIKRFI
jgi:transcriptional regulator with XRE-family HTH domain